MACLTLYWCLLLTLVAWLDDGLGAFGDFLSFRVLCGVDIIYFLVVFGFPCLVSWALS